VTTPKNSHVNEYEQLRVYTSCNVLILLIYRYMQVSNERKCPLLLIATKIELVTGKVNNTVLYVKLFCHKKFYHAIYSGYYLRVATMQGKH